MQIDREQFKKYLINQGVDITDQQLTNYLNSKLNVKPIEISDLSEDIFNVVQEREIGNTDETGRANRHNNPGAHIWTPEREEKYGAQKGEPFTGKREDGTFGTYFTAKYDTLEQGRAASRGVVEERMKVVADQGIGFNDPNYGKAFAYEYTRAEGEELNNYGRAVQNVVNKNLNYTQSQNIGQLQSSTNLIDNIDFSQYKIPEERNAALDFVGNALWNLLDTGTLGIAGAVDTDDSLQKFLQGEEGPTTFAGRTGAALGGLAGFMVPMGGARAAAGAGIRSLSKFGSKKFTSKVASEGAEFLSKKAGTKAQGYKRYQDLTKNEQNDFFKRITDDVIQNSSKSKQFKIDDAFAKKLASRSDEAISNSLKAYRLPNTQANVQSIRNIIEKGLLQNGNKSVLPISTLQQRIALMVGNKIGSGKVATIATHAVEEAFLFAAVETPMEIFQSINDEREMDLLGRAGYSMLLGTSIGTIKSFGGGKTFVGTDGKESSISKEVFRKAMRKISGKRPYSDLDVNSAADGEMLRKMAETQWKGFGGGAAKVFKDALSKTKFKNKTIDQLKDIDDLSTTPEGREALQNILDFTYSRWESKWSKEFTKDVMEDLQGSLGRMVAGASVFSAPVIFDENIPMEDKMFNVLLGAFMTKRRYATSYVDKDGVLQKLGGDVDYAQRTNDINQYLSYLGMRPKDFVFNAYMNDALIKDKFIRGAADSDDIKSIIGVLESEKLIVNQDVRESKAKGKRAKKGDDDLYDSLKLLFDGDIIPSDGRRMLDPSEITTTKLKKVINSINNLKIKDFDRTNIRSTSDLIDVIDNASDATWKNFERIHLQSAASIFNHFAGKTGNSKINVEEGSTPTFFKLRGAKLNSKNEATLAQYNRLLNLIEGRIADVHPSENFIIDVKNSDFEGLGPKIEANEKELNLLINGTADLDPSMSAKLAQEGWTLPLYERYAAKKDIRVAYDKLSNLSDSKKFTSLETSAENQPKHNGELIEKYNSDLFIDPDTGFMLYDKIIFEGKINENLQRFATQYHAALKRNPEYTIPMLEGQSKNLVISAGSSKLKQLGDLRRLLNREGINIFSKRPSDGDKFLQKYLDFSINKALAGSTKRDGKLLNDVDRSVLKEMIEIGIVGRNFETVQITEVVNKLKPIENNITSKNLDDLMSKDKTFGDMMKTISVSIGKDADVIAKKLLADYKEVIEPFMKEGANGILKESATTIAQVSAPEMQYWISSLRYIQARNIETSHKALVEQFERLSRDSDYSKSSQIAFDHVYKNIKNGNVNMQGMIAYLNKKGVFDPYEKELKFDPENKDLAVQLKTIIEEKDFDLFKEGNDNEISNIIDDLKGANQKDNLVDVYINESRESIRKRYNFDNDYDFSGKTTDDYIKNGYILDGKKKLYIDGVKSNDDADGRMSTEQATKFVNDISKMLFADKTQRTITRLSASTGGVDADFNNKMYDNSMFRSLNFLLTGMDSPVKSYNSFAIIDTKFVDEGITKNTRSDEDAYNKMIDSFNGREHSQLVSKSYDSTDEGKLITEQNPGYIVISMGDLTYDIGISRDYLPTFGKNIDELLQKNRKDFPDDIYRQSHKTLENIFDDLYTKTEIVKDGKGTGEFDYEFKGKGGSVEADQLEVLVTHSLMNGVKIGSKQTGLQKNWWKHLSETHNKNEGLDVLKTARRIRLLSNVSMKELSTKHVDDVTSLITKYGGDADKEILETFARIKKNKGLKMIFAEDENFTKIGTSINKQLEQQIALAKAKLSKAGVEIELKSTNPSPKGDGTVEYAGGGDISPVDSYTAVSPKVMDALYKLAGAGDIGGLGGLKPIIHRLGDNIIVGKTAFISDPKIDNFLAKNDIDMITFGSAAKIHYDKSKFIDFKDLKELESGSKLGSDDLAKVEVIGLDELSLGAVVNSNKDASLPYQTFKDLNVEESRSVYNWLIANNLSEYDSQFANFMNPKRNDGQAFSQFVSQSRSTDNTSSLAQTFFKHKLNPLSSLVKDDFVDMIKNQYLDKSGIFTPKTKYGTQSVTSPGSDMKFTIFDAENKIFEYGQIQLSNVSGLKNVNLKDMHLIKRNSDSADELIQVTKAKGLGLSNDMTVEQVVKKLDKTQYELAVVARRNPNTRPGDMVILGVKDILPYKYGNTTRVNAGDFAFRLEGDHDIDKVDVFWDTPNVVLEKWNALSGEVIRVNPDGPDKKTTLNVAADKQYDWLTPGDMRQYRKDIEFSMKMRGTLVKAQRVLQGLSEYDNVLEGLKNSDGLDIKGFALKLPKAAIHIDPDMLKEARKVLAKDIQDITDATTGYDKQRFEKWERNFYFGDGNPKSPYNGIFKKVNKENGKYNTEESTAGIKDKFYQDVVIEALKPYRSLLQLGTNVYADGVSKKVRYSDIIEQVKMFDADMYGLNMKSYYKLRRKYSSGGDKSKLDQLFLTENGLKKVSKNKKLLSTDFREVYAGWNNSIRPDLRNVTSADLDKMLPFERSMAFIALNDRSQVSLDRKLYGDRAQEFENFFTETFHNDNIDDSASQFINQINKNAKLLGYTGFLGSKLYKLRNAEFAARRSRQFGRADYLKDQIEKVESQKTEIENKINDMLAKEEFDNNALKQLREEAKRSVVRQIYKNSRFPSGFLTSKELPIKNFEYKTIQGWANSKEGSKQIFDFVRKKGILRFEGIRNAEYIDLRAADSAIQVMANDLRPADPRINDRLNEMVSIFNKEYGQLWGGILSGKDHVHNNIKANSTVMHRLDEMYKSAEDLGGYGKLVMWKLMKPKRESTVFTYVAAGNDSKIMPAYQKNDIKKYKLGLRWFNQTKLVTDIDKDIIFETVASVHNRIHDGFHGQSRLPVLEDIQLKQELRDASDVMTGSPLLDDINPYSFDGGMQQQLINPTVADALGIEPNQSMAHLLYNKPLLPSSIKTMAASTIMPYTPKAYINVATGRHPGIHGTKDYLNALSGKARAFLGDAMDQNLVFDTDSPTRYSEELPTLSGEGRDAVKAKLKSKLDCKG